MENLDAILRDVYGATARFRAGQKEAIQAVLAGQRVLVVQKTGWGKSLVYFMAVKILRKRGNGPCIIISPLLALMHNQLEAARQWGLRADTINSENKDAWEAVKAALATDVLDILFISPERLGNAEFVQDTLSLIQKNICMLVIDEAHCISDWGHDFRPDYLRIVKVIQQLPPNVPLLATTATANDRVIADISAQFGNQLRVLRGELARDTLHIQVLKNLRKKEERLAWMAEHLHELAGTGIIYCLTTGDCDVVSQWLNKKGFKVEAYYSGNKKSEEKKAIEQSFFNNDVKALVATVALGMGVDKPDIDFIIHFQCPGNLIAYYQQIGRAGRDGRDAYAILMLGDEDDRICQYFIQSAFPTAEELEQVISVLTKANSGMKRAEILKGLNLSSNKVDQALKFLQIHEDIYKEKTVYYKTARAWNPDFTHSREITAMREQEMAQMHAYADTQECYMQFVTQALNDGNAHRCGKCGNCCPGNRLSEDVSREGISAAIEFLHHEAVEIVPRKLWAIGGKIPEDEQMESGYALSNYADAGWGVLVKKDKYETGKFTEPLVQAAIEFLRPHCQKWGITLITAVPSLRRPRLVYDFAKAVASGLEIPFQECLKKVIAAPEQKKQNNSSWQWQNAMDSFAVMGAMEGNVLLIDDMVDSRWTFTVCASKMRLAGADRVFPFALANSGGR